MRDHAPIPSEYYDQLTESPAGYRDKRGEWRPAKPVAYAPLFQWPAHVARFLRWLKSYVLGWNLLWFALTLTTWRYFQPSLETCQTFRFGWIAQMLGRNLALLWIVYGGWHLYLYMLRRKGHRGKYSPRWQNPHGATFLFQNQVLDNLFWTCGSGCLTWTAYEVVSMWMYASGRLPYLEFKTSPVGFVAVVLLIPIWREFHFYWIHRFIHWKPLYDRIHYLHHYNINPGPWSGLAMHPLEHLLYFSVTLIHWILPSHPIHLLFNAQHTALTPAHGHSGFEGEINERIPFGSYFHYLHHRHFDCNYGESTIPLDQWFGSFNDGSRTDSEIREARRTYREYTIDRIVEESPEVKSFYLKRADGKPLEPYQPGQHLMFKVPVGEEGRTALRFYTLSDFGRTDSYRISVKRELAPPDQPDAPPGRVSNHLHDRLKPGDTIQARGPLGDFTPDVFSRRPIVLVAGGVGITPILAMLKACLQRRPNRKVYLFLAFRDPSRRLFQKEIDAVLAKHPSAQAQIFFDEISADELDGASNLHAGRLDIDAIQQVVPRVNLDFYLCGPRPLMQAITEGLKREGLTDLNIHTESFTQGRPGDGGTLNSGQHEITFTRSDKVLRWDSEFQNLLEFAESNGVPMEAGCMFGECGACSVKLEAGEVEYHHETAIKPQPGHCLPCSCRPKSAVKIDA